jgi:hypothetical protein
VSGIGQLATDRPGATAEFDFRRGTTATFAALFKVEQRSAASVFLFIE